MTRSSSTWLSLALLLVPAAAHAQTAPDPAQAAPAPYAAPQQPPQVPYYYPQPYAYPYLQQPQQAPAKAPISPRRIPYHGREIPAGATVVTRGHNGLLAAGLSVFGGLYLISVITAAASCSPGDSASTCRSNTAWLASRRLARSSRPPIRTPRSAGATSPSSMECSRSRASRRPSAPTLRASSGWSFQAPRREGPRPGRAGRCCPARPAQRPERRSRSPPSEPRRGQRPSLLRSVNRRTGTGSARSRASSTPRSRPI